MSALRALRPLTRATRAFTTTSTTRLSATVDSTLLSSITAAEKQLTSQDGPVPNGPTARAQAHANTPLTAQVVHDVAMGERAVTGSETPVRNGPAAVAQAAFTRAQQGQQGQVQGRGQQQQHSGRLDAQTMRTITDREKEITGLETPVRGGPTAQAQKHAGEAIGSEVLSDITKGEKEVTGGERVKGGPTSAAQSELGKSRS